MIPEKLPIARIGKTVGLRGDLRLNLLSDFPEQFKKGATFMSDRGDLTVSSFNAERGTIRFEGIDNIDDAKRLTNAYLYTTKEATEEACKLNEGEYFWYQIIGLEVDDNGNLLGKVEEIERLAGTDYLLVKTDPALVEDGFAKSFLVPYVERYIDRVDLQEGKVFTTGAKVILEAS
ncbi:ribosome maturation factor RimM [Hydrogenimonas thermophila]|uniref:Ribosome maturation factor RimM n=1 Tax=Hydrogenimonas thermophila TaxID=223786 RepID=A0A1I5UGJ9_9BACT|nr:ribosome maturation factor RimM [Hydrogenimonas thermophila]WOE69523.1 ribosome maturation factor RimM [Hydrogenimonas thermophila]WOE72037.1 ribosome maturation factor RimM [Hydrogenimonas thermophila]SFP94298.1 16S rRNA processing protein RimM [Hydrogenimonas thermophila]